MFTIYNIQISSGRTVARRREGAITTCFDRRVGTWTDDVRVGSPRLNLRPLGVKIWAKAHGDAVSAFRAVQRTANTGQKPTEGFLGNWLCQHGVHPASHWWHYAVKEHEQNTWLQWGRSRSGWCSNPRWRAHRASATRVVARVVGALAPAIIVYTESLRI